MLNGSLQKKSSSKYWYAVISITDENGRRKTKWVTTKQVKKTEATKVLRTILKEMEEGSFVDKTSLLFADFMENWLNEVVKTQVEHTTYSRYKHTVDKHIAPYFRAKGVLLQNVTTLMLQEYINSKISNNTATKQKSLSPNTVKKHYINISQALDYAVKIKLINRNPAKDVELPKIKKFAGSFYSVEQLDKLLNLAVGLPIESALVLTVHYGLRRGEVLGLRWSDIDFNNNSIHISNTRVRADVEIEKAPKTESSRRTLPLLETVKEYLLKLKRQQAKDKLLLGKSYVDNDYVCRWTDGRPLLTTYISRAFKLLLERNKMPLIRFHDLRHSTASYLLKLGLSMKEIQYWLGHSQISTTMDIYTHIDLQMKNDVGKKVDGLFKIG